MSKCRVYLAMKMSGLKAKDITKKSDEAIRIFLKYGLEPVSPWTKELDMYDPEQVIDVPTNGLREIWKADKDEIMSCHVVCDIDGHLFSRGTGIEVGFNRYALMRPTVFVDTALTSIRSFESDYVAPNIDRAAQMIRDNWGTWDRRIVWRLFTVWNLSCVYRRIKRELEGWK